MSISRSTASLPNSTKEACTRSPSRAARSFPSPRRRGRHEGVAVDATHVYWTEFRNHVIRRASHRRRHSRDARQPGVFRAPVDADAFAGQTSLTYQNTPTSNPLSHAEGIAVDNDCVY